MSMTLTRLPLEQIGMNAPKRRSARLSQEGSHAEDTENHQDVEGTRAAGRGAAKRKDAVTVATKESDGAGAAAGAGRRKRKDYDLEVDDFKFTKKRARTTASTTAKDPAPAKAAAIGEASPTKQRAAPLQQQPSAQAADKSMPPPEKPAPKAPDKKSRRRLPTTPDREQPKRRSKRLSNEGPEEQQQQSQQQKQHNPSPHKPAHAKSHANHARSPSPSELARPVTVEKKRKADVDSVEEQKTMRIQLPFQDTPVIRRNREMRKTGGVQSGSRRSSSGMRGRRASSLIDEGRGSALPHAEVLSCEFYKHISAEVPENRRMRCLLGWCGMRALPTKPDAPKESTPAANLEFQALQAARVIQEELSQDLITKGSLSDWFSRDDVVPPTAVTLRKKPNPRNVANAAKAEELEKELERLKKERAEWDSLIASAKSAIPHEPKQSETAVQEGSLSPINASNLDSPQRRILEQLQAPTLALSSSSGSNPSTATIIQPASPPSSSDPAKPAAENPPAQSSSSSSNSLEDRLRHVTQNLEFTIDQFAHGVHALATTRETGDRLADHTLADAADVLARREQERRDNSKAVDPLLALRGLARVLNGNRSAAKQR